MVIHQHGSSWSTSRTRDALNECSRAEPAHGIIEPVHICGLCAFVVGHFNGRFNHIRLVEKKAVGRRAAFGKGMPFVQHRSECLLVRMVEEQKIVYMKPTVLGSSLGISLRET